MVVDLLERGAGQAPELAVEELAAMGDVLVALLALEPLTDLLARVARGHEVEPVARRAVRALRRDDLDDVAVLQLVVERHEAVVHLGADAGVADLGVDAVGEVERRGAGRHVLHVALGGEDEDLVLEDVELDALDELGRVGDVELPLHELADPGQLGVVGAVAARALLVAPVSGDAELADTVHVVGPDLHLERLAVDGHDGGVEALVHVVLGHRDVVVELPGDGPPERVDDAERGVALAHVGDEHAQGVDVVDLAELGALAAHLLVDAVEVLRPAGELGLDARRLEGLVQLVHGSPHVRLAGLAMALELAGELPVGIRVEHLEGEVLELPLDLPDAQALCERRVDLGRLAGDALLLGGRQRPERAHVVEPVGQLDEDDADVLGHGQEHLADVLGLLLLVAQGAELTQLGDAAHEPADIRPEACLDVGERVLGVLGDVVQERGGDRDRDRGRARRGCARPPAGG